MKTFQEVQQMTEREVNAWWFEVFAALPLATEEEVRDGRLEFVHTAAPIVAQLPSARRYTKNMENVIGYQGDNYEQFIVLSAEDEARVGTLRRAWERS